MLNRSRIAISAWFPQHDPSFLCRWKEAVLLQGGKGLELPSIK
jgi:hypothetical protein